MSCSEETECRLIVGIGNPGAEFAGTRHNAGFEVIDRLLGKFPTVFSPRRARSAQAWEGRFGGRNVILMKPLTYVNLSGDAVLPLMKGENLAPSEILIVYDDIDLPVGRLRIRKNGGSAGHNGMKSVIGALHSEAFPRLRIGIGDENSRRRADYVLTSFEGKEKESFEKALDKAVEAVELLLRRGISKAMNVYNSTDCSESAETKTTDVELTKTHQQEVES